MLILLEIFFVAIAGLALISVFTLRPFIIRINLLQDAGRQLTASSSVQQFMSSYRACHRVIRMSIVVAVTFLLIAHQTSMAVLANVEQTSRTTSVDAHLNWQGETVRLSELFPDYQTRCFFMNNEKESNRFTSTGAELLSLLKLDALGNYLLKAASRLNPAICFENRLDGTHGYYDYKYNAVVLQETIDVQQQSITLVHELRHVEQVLYNFGVTTDYDIDETVRVRFAVEADAQAIATLFAWRLRAREFEWAWDSLAELEQYSDISEAFEKEMYLSGSEEDALLVAFRQWYASHWRVSVYSMDAKTQYLDLLDETKLIRQYKSLPNGFFDPLCKLPDGKNYHCSSTVEIKKNPQSLH